MNSRNAGILPPAFGSSGMLRLVGTEQPDPHTKFKLFQSNDIAGPSKSIPQDPMAASCSRKRHPVSDDANENHSDCSTPNTTDWLPPLLANEALAQAVSQVQMRMDNWAPLYLFKLFVVLVEPPPGLDLSAIEGLDGYLIELLARIGGLVENGIREIASRCWCALLGKCSAPGISLV